MKKYFLSFFAVLCVLLSNAQQLSVTHNITDESDELNTAVITINAVGGQAPYQYFWSEKSVDTKTNEIQKATEGKEYSVKVTDASGNSKELTFNVPAVSVPEKMSSAFAPVVGFMDTYFFFDPFYAIGLYDNRVTDDNGNVLLNPNGTERTIKVPFMVIWLILGALFFTFRFRFINFRGIKHSIDLVRGKYDDPNAIGEVSHFQALATAVSGTVGLGNIAGVAVAVATGGPGATFWLILAGLIGMSTKFVECTLGVKYRVLEEDGTISGGPMEYLKKGFEERGFPAIFGPPGETDRTTGQLEKLARVPAQKGTGHQLGDLANRSGVTNDIVTHGGRDIAFAKGIDWWIEEQVTLQITKINQIKPLSFKRQNLLAFSVHFKTNVSCFHRIVGYTFFITNVFFPS